MAPVLPNDDPIELSQLIVDDSDGEGEANTSLAKTTSTLGAVKTKLTRHRSHETEVSARGKGSVGHSEEEVARRAELRRFRHQRIQDELKDDKKNQASNEDSSSTSHRSTQYLSALIDVGQPRGGPRDNLTFGFESPPSIMTRLSQASSHESKEALEDQAGDLSLQMSGSPEIANPPNTLNESARESKDQLPSLRVASPQEDSPLQSYPESIRGSPSQKSLGCSYSSPRLDRVLGPNSEFDSLRCSQISEDQSALGIWLIAQSLRTRSNSTGLFAENQKAEAVILDERAITPAVDLGGIDRVEDTPQSGLQQGHIPPCNSTEPWPQEGPSQNPQSSQDSSSTYPSVLPSFSPSPDRAQSNAPHLSAKDIESLQLTPFQWQGNLAEFRASEARSSYFTAEDDISYSEIGASHVRTAGMPAATLGLTSASFSETESFRQRETELRTIEKRFGEVLSRKRPNPIASSRFKEEFHDASSGPRRASFKMKLGFTNPKRSKSRSVSAGTNSLSGLFPDYKSTDADKKDHQRSASGARPRNKLKKQAPRSLSHPVGQITLPLSAASSRTMSKGNNGHSSNLLDPVPKTSASAVEPNEPAGTDSREPLKPSERQSGAWSRFPSHNRTERGRHVSAQEGYRMRESDLRDFISGGQEQGKDGIKNTKSPLPTEVAPRSLPEKLARGVKMGLSKLIPTKTDGSAGLVEPQREAEIHQSPGYDGDSSADVTVARKDSRCADCSNSSLCGKTSENVGSAGPQLSGSRQEPEVQAPSSTHARNGQMSADAVGSVAASDENNGVVGDDFHTPISHLGNQGHGETFKDVILGTGLLPEEQKTLRRWRSNIDGPVEGALAIWDGPVVAQSLSMNNLRASSDEGSDDEMV